MGVYPLKVLWYAMLQPNKTETALFVRKCPGDKTEHMRPMVATLQLALFTMATMLVFKLSCK